MNQRVLYSTIVRSVTRNLCVLYLSETNSDLCRLQHKLTGFYNRDLKCLQRGTNWALNKAVCASSLKG